MLFILIFLIFMSSSFVFSIKQDNSPFSKSFSFFRIKDLISTRELFNRSEYTDFLSEYNDVLIIEQAGDENPRSQSRGC